MRTHVAGCLVLPDTPPDAGAKKKQTALTKHDPLFLLRRSTHPSKRNANKPTSTPTMRNKTTSSKIFHPTPHPKRPKNK